MKLFAKKDKRTDAEKAYDMVMLDLQVEPFGTDRYKELMATAEKLHTMIMEEKSTKKSVSPDALLSVGGTILSILTITQHERLHNITSKALSFVPKGRVR